MVRRGITRTVILVGRYAIKVPSLRAHGDGAPGVLWSLARGLLANQSERTWWGYENMRGGLCPVLRSWLGGLVQVYPRCEPLPVNADGEYDGELPKLDPHPGDDKPDNYGLLDGRVVRLDYCMDFNACPHERSGALNRLREDAAG